MKIAHLKQIISADERCQFKNADVRAPFKFICLIPAKFQRC